MSEINICWPKADRGFDPAGRPRHCWHPMAGTPGFAYRDHVPTSHEFCCRCHTVQPVPAVVPQ